MPSREYSRDQDWLLPPSLGELIAPDHPVRFVAEFVSLIQLGELGIVAEPAVVGAPSYAAELLLGVWVYGFMARVRSSRKLERACRENVCFMWLAGSQKPDHVTLARFYQRNRQAMHQLLRRSVQLAVEVGLVDFALQAVDGSRMAAASRDSLRKRDGIERLLKQTEAEIVAMEQALVREEEEPGAVGPTGKGLRGREDLRDRLKHALAVLQRMEQGGEGCEDAGEQERNRSAEPKVSTSDPEAVLVRGRQGHLVGYNAQAVADGKAQVIVAADVAPCTSDARQLLPMVAEAEKMTGRQAEAVVADGGYHTAANLMAMQERQVPFYAPDPQQHRKGDAPEQWPYHKDNFRYDPATDTLVCPQGQALIFERVVRRNHGRVKEGRVYRCTHCAQCSACCPKGCTQNKRGRHISLYGHEQQLIQHRKQMASPQAQQIMKRRKGIVEPVFACIKEHLDCSRFLLRGLTNVLGEWHLICSAYNLLKIWRLWWRPQVLA